MVEGGGSDREIIILVVELVWRYTEGGDIKSGKMVVIVAVLVVENNGVTSEDSRGVWWLWW